MLREEGETCGKERKGELEDGGKDRRESSRK